MNFFNSLATRFVDGMTQRAAFRVYEHIKYLDSSLLKGAGISPALLALGPRAYPWREDFISTGKVENVSLAANDSTILLAIKELNACSDAELSDLGLSRSGIAEAVRNGRPGIEFPASVASHQEAA